jgi:hypothetical protein
MRRPAGGGRAFVGFAVALALTLAGLLLPDDGVSGTDRVVVIGAHGLSWQVVIDLIEDGKLPTMAGLVEDGAAFGDIIADGYEDDSAILASIITGRLPRGQPGEPVWEEFVRQGQKASAGGFPFGHQEDEILESGSAARLLRDEPDRHLFLYFTGLHDAQGEPRIQGYQSLDELLGLLIEADSGRGTFFLFSERGNPEGRVTYRPYFPRLTEWPAIGFFLAWGKHVRKAVEPLTVAPVDLAPTLLQVGGAEIPNDMDGLVLFKVFDESFRNKRRLAFRP